MPTVTLNLSDIDAKIRAYEQKYAVASLDMLKDGNVRQRIGEDEVLKWETYIRQRLDGDELNIAELEEIEEIRRIVDEINSDPPRFSTST